MSKAQFGVAVVRRDINPNTYILEELVKLKELHHFFDINMNILDFVRLIKEYDKNKDKPENKTLLEQLEHLSTKTENFKEYMEWFKCESRYNKYVINQFHEHVLSPLYESLLLDSIFSNSTDPVVIKECRIRLRNIYTFNKFNKSFKFFKFNYNTNEFEECNGYDEFDISSCQKISRQTLISKLRTNYYTILSSYEDTHQYRQLFPDGIKTADIVPNEFFEKVKLPLSDTSVLYLVQNYYSKPDKILGISINIETIEDRFVNEDAVKFLDCDDCNYLTKEKPDLMENVEEEIKNIKDKIKKTIIECFTINKINFELICKKNRFIFFYENYELNHERVSKFLNFEEKMKTVRIPPSKENSKIIFNIVYLYNLKKEEKHDDYFKFTIEVIQQYIIKI